MSTELYTNAYNLVPDEFRGTPTAEWFPTLVGRVVDLSYHRAVDLFDTCDKLAAVGYRYGWERAAAAAAGEPCPAHSDLAEPIAQAAKLVRETLEPLPLPDEEGDERRLIFYLNHATGFRLSPLKAPLQRLAERLDRDPIRAGWDDQRAGKPLPGLPTIDDDDDDAMVADPTWGT